MSTGKHPNLEDSNTAIPSAKKAKLDVAESTKGTAPSSNTPAPTINNNNGSANNNMAQNGTSPMEVDHNGTNQDIDEGLYSRQLYVLGHEAMRRMNQSDVLISGVRGLGLEVAKNVVLGGVKSVTIHDEGICSMDDLSSQFYLSEKDIGKNRAEITVPQLAELNKGVPVTSFTGKLTPEYLKKFRVVVLTNSSLEEQLWVNEVTHSNGAAFISTSTRGLFGSIFCDFGPQFTVTDVNGNEPSSVMLSAITKEEKGVVACLDDARHKFEDGDWVTFKEVVGMTQLNACEPHQVTVLGPYTFSIGDTRSFDDYVKGGIAVQVKKPKIISFKSLKESLKLPEFIIGDYAKFDRPQQLHIAFQALDEYQKKYNSLPKSWDKEDAANLLDIAEDIRKRDGVEDELNKDVIEKFSFLARGDINPMSASLGGIVAQELMKACSGKFHPIMQWFYFDALECLNEDKVLTPEETAPIGSRYDGQIAIFGKDFVEKVKNLKYFIVGAGAIGCELLKNFAMLGVACGPEGKLHVTDMDTIERSNLNRQFLFRDRDIGRLKSMTAKEAVKKMNPFINIQAYEDRVGPDTEHVYNDDFFESLDGVANALDNVDARVYVDRRCVFYRKSLLESGTLGTKGNVQVVVPHLTESYSSSHDPPDPSIPICTLKNFPNAIEHTLQWARDDFEGLFKISPTSAELYLFDQSEFMKLLSAHGSQPLETVEAVKRVLIDDRPNTFADCVKWARVRFEWLFSSQIQQLLFNFPSNQKTSTGTDFWSGPKRCPHPISFSVDDDLHVDYILSAANLWASIFNLPNIPVRDREEVKRLAGQIVLPKFVPRAGVTIAINEAEAANQDNKGMTDSDAISDVLSKIPPASELKGRISVTAIDFEKDDDDNFHMDFIVATSNLRAQNYDIAPADKHQSKLIAGRIIPAIATTTSLVSGLVCFELLKLVQGHNKMEQFKNAFINMALPFFTFSEPVACAKNKYYEKEFTIWDRFELDGNKVQTLAQFMDHFKNEEKLSITMLSQGVSMLYSFFMSSVKAEERLKMTMSQIVETVSKKPLEPHVRNLVFEICANDEDDEDVEVPYVRYTLPKDH